MENETTQIINASSVTDASPVDLQNGSCTNIVMQSVSRPKTDDRKDIRLPLEPELFLDLKKMAKIHKMSRIALLTQYVIEGYRRDLESNHDIFESRGFEPRFLTVSGLDSMKSSDDDLSEEIKAALKDEAIGSTNVGSIPNSLK